LVAPLAMLLVLVAIGLQVVHVNVANMHPAVNNNNLGVGQELDSTRGRQQHVSREVYLQSHMLELRPCCFVDGSDSFLPAYSTLEGLAVDAEPLPVIFTNWPDTEVPLSNTEVTFLKRNDAMGFFLEFNYGMDKLAMKLTNYDSVKRYEYVTGILTLKRPILLSEYFSDPAYGVIQSAACTQTPMPRVQNFASTLFASANNAMFQTSVSLVSTVIHVFNGAIVVMVTSDAGLDKLHLFPMTHPLRGQSQLSFYENADHFAFSDRFWRHGGVRVPVVNITLEAGQSLLVPPFWGHRIITRKMALFSVK